MPLAKKIIKEGKFTYQEYLTWKDNERWELIDGRAYNMTPAPASWHQTIAANFHYVLKSKLKGMQCKPFVAPTDVVLSEHDVVQPDVFVICDKSKIKAAIHGSPDLIIEILSPSTAIKDKREKKALYEKYGVKEYLIADPSEFYVERFVLDDKGSYSRYDLFEHTETITLISLKDIEIPLSDVFEVEE